MTLVIGALCERAHVFARDIASTLRVTHKRRVASFGQLGGHNESA